MGIFDFFKRKNKNNEEFVYPKDEVEMWIRDTYCLWSYCKCENWECIGGGCIDKSERVEGLIEDWDIENREDLFQMVEYLVKYKNGEFPAWDLCRATQLIGMGYTIDYLDRNELRSISCQIGKVMQNTFSSWEELMLNYIAGYSDWVKDICEDPENCCIKKRNQSYEILKNLPNGPFKQSWNLNLV